MALSKNSKRTIDYTVPTLAAGVAAYLAYRNNKQAKDIAIIAGIVLVIMYIITTQATKAIYLTGPAQVPTGGGCSDYDPTTLANSLKKDITCVMCMRDVSLYNKILELSDCETISLCNYWNKNIYPDVEKSLPMAIADEGGVNALFKNVQKPLANKFSRLKLY